MHRNVAAITAAQGPELAPITLVTRSVVDDTRRFTVAHEFAHLVMDEASGPADDADVEARADAFAGELLAQRQKLFAVFLVFQLADAMDSEHFIFSLRQKDTHGFQ